MRPPKNGLSASPGRRPSCAAHQGRRDAGQVAAAVHDGLQEEAASKESRYLLVDFHLCLCCCLDAFSVESGVTGRHAEPNEPGLLGHGKHPFGAEQRLLSVVRSVGAALRRRNSRLVCTAGHLAR